jgi:hypothetical protein
MTSLQTRHKQAIFYNSTKASSFSTLLSLKITVGLSNYMEWGGEWGGALNILFLYINIHFTTVETQNNLILHIMLFYLHAVPTVKQHAQHKSQNSLSSSVLAYCCSFAAQHETCESVITNTRKWLLKLADALQSIQKPFALGGLVVSGLATGPTGYSVAGSNPT